MVKSILLAILVALAVNLLVLQVCIAAPEAAAASSSGESTSAATSTTSASSGSSSSSAHASPPNLIGGMLNMATVPLNTLTASLTSLGVPNIATGALSTMSNLFQQAGTAYGR